MTATPPGTRAVERLIEAGDDSRCAHCQQPIRFMSSARANRKVIANIYRRHHWDRVEHFHAACYLTAGAPHGTADPTRTRKLDRVKTS